MKERKERICPHQSCRYSLQKTEKSGNYDLSVPANLKTANSIKAIATETRKGSLEHDNRLELYFNDSNNELVYPNKQNPQLPVSFSKQASFESIKRNLTAVNSFAESYKKYTQQKDCSACTRIFEIILY
ncbi:hypothetical protein [Syntrophaceticus schinkii]|uniref:Uncharacterized protein n=1 Tax=Syntrophaceticus schinkii TaxID=499207 RepID=A0A0B7MKB9_9FIRM|nr:hypothetical protein [Syntrophaceticus schinkii]CEO90485.1 hypothetical protein SSCH_900001 [Syntrophaceticus schinkii]